MDKDGDRDKLLAALDESHITKEQMIRARLPEEFKDKVIPQWYIDADDSGEMIEMNIEQSSGFLDLTNMVIPADND